MGLSVLIVDDHADFRAFARALLDADGFAVCEALAGDEDAPLVVLTSSRDASSYRRRLGESSALGFIPKAELSGAELATLTA